MMYGTRKEVTRLIKRAFGGEEKLALLVWTEQDVMAQAEDMTAQEADAILCAIGNAGLYGHMDEGISSRTVRELPAALAGNDALPGGSLQAVLSALSGSGIPADMRLNGDATQGGSIPASVMKQVHEEQARSRTPVGPEQHAVAEKALASTARELDRQRTPELPPAPRGQEMEHKELNHEPQRHIQKER